MFLLFQLLFSLHKWKSAAPFHYARQLQLKPVSQIQLPVSQADEWFLFRFLYDNVPSSAYHDSRFQINQRSKAHPLSLCSVFHQIQMHETHHGKNVPVLNNSILHIPLLLLLWYSVLYIGIANF